MNSTHSHSLSLEKITSTSPVIETPNHGRSSTRPVLVIHGGAGTMSREGSTPEQRQLYIEVLRKSLVTGHEILKDGGEAMDAAVAAVGVMEGECF